MKRFPDFDYMVTTLLTPGAVIWVLLRDTVDNQIVSSDFLATITLLPYDYSVAPPDVVKDPNSSWDVYLQSSEGKFINIKAHASDLTHTNRR